MTQAFPKLATAARGTPASEEHAAIPLTDGAAAGADGESAVCDEKRIGGIHRVPALLALLHVVRGVPPEALSQELDSVVSAVVQALGSDLPALQTAALETFQVVR